MQDLLGLRDRPPVALVLDVDETLWRCAIHGVHKRKLPKVDAHAEIRYLEKGRVCTAGCDISWRPGLPEFLQWIRRRRDQGLLEGPWVFTTGTSDYINAVLQLLDPDGDLFGARVLSKRDCIKTATPGFYLKDLTMVPSSGGLKRTILVDNNPVSCILHPENSILIHDWLGAGENDTELARVISVLEDVMGMGNDVGSVVGATEGYVGYRRSLATLHDLIDDPDSAISFGQALQRAKMVWPEIHAIKRDFLGPSPACSL